jgi:hypothetical protein
VAQENPQVLLLKVATSLSFRFLVVMPFAGFSGIIFGESPVCLLLDDKHYLDYVSLVKVFG